MTSIIRFVFVALCCALLAGLSGCQDSIQNAEKPATPFGLLIQNATVIDGTGAPAFKADIRVVADRIISIGEALKPTQGEQLIDASGLV